jgi:lipopolysaccharide export LptBFGC system permease protein LptF
VCDVISVRVDDASVTEEIMGVYSSQKLAQMYQQAKQREEELVLKSVSMDLDDEKNIARMEELLQKAKKANEKKKQHQIRLKQLFSKHVNGITYHANSKALQPLLVKAKDLIEVVYKSFESAEGADPAKTFESYNHLVTVIIDTYNELGVSGKALETILERHHKRRREEPPPRGYCRCQGNCLDSGKARCACLKTGGCNHRCYCYNCGLKDESESESEDNS